MTIRGPIVTPQRPIQYVAPDQTHTAIGRFTNPIPFGPYDWSAKPSFVRRQTVDGTQPTNINLFKNPIPFGPYDYNIAHTVPSVKQFDQQPHYPEFYPNPIPFGPFDYNKVAQPPPAKEPPVWSLNINLFTNPFPFNQYDWSARPALLRREPPHVPLGTNVNIFTNPIPFGPYDWSKPFFPRVLPPDALQLPLSLYANLMPVTPDDFSHVSPVDLVPQWQQPYNQNLYSVTTVTTPFGPFDWSKTTFPLAAAPWVVPFNANLFTNPIPFVNVNFTAPFVPPPTPPQPIPYNLNLYTLGPVAAPFNQTDWPLTHSIRGLPGLSDQGIFAFQVPFGPFDWSKPFFPNFAKQDPSFPNIALLTTAPAPPIIPVDLSYSSFPRFFPPPTVDGALIDVTQPFALYDWSKPSAFGTSAPHPYPYNLSLFAIPFGPFDWSKPSAFGPAKDQPVWALNPNLFPPPAPFAQYDWSRPRLFAASFAHPFVYNLNLYTVVAPGPPGILFNQYDWSKPQQPYTSVSSNPYVYNINLFPPPVVTVTLIQRTLTGVGL